MRYWTTALIYPTAFASPIATILEKNLLLMKSSKQLQDLLYTLTKHWHVSYTSLAQDKFALTRLSLQLTGRKFILTSLKQFFSFYLSLLSFTARQKWWVLHEFRLTWCQICTVAWKRGWVNLPTTHITPLSPNYCDRPLCIKWLLFFISSPSSNMRRHRKHQELVRLTGGYRQVNKEWAEDTDL